MRVQKFDKNGKFLLTIGRRGQGPGEFQTFNGFFIDSGNNLYVGQYLSIKKFGPDGKLSNTIVSKMPIFSFMVTREHNAIISTLWGGPQSLDKEQGGIRWQRPRFVPILLQARFSGQR
jgi:hypothetical protein